MTDTPERDPTRTEDVEEALEWLEVNAKFGTLGHTAEVNAKVVRDEIDDLRSRLEEAQADVSRKMKEAKDARDDAWSARRRSEALEEALRAVQDRIEHAMGSDGETQSRHLHDARGAILDALDSREDEGDGRTWHESGCPALGGEDCECRDASWGAPFADEPEGDGRAEVFAAARELRRVHGDQPVSGEGDERDWVCPKCGNDDLHTRYCDGEWLGGSRKTGAINRCDRPVHDEEGFHHTCRTCQYKWTTLDPTHADARGKVPSAETIDGWLDDWGAGPADDYYGSLGKYLHDMIVRHRSRLSDRHEEDGDG